MHNNNQGVVQSYDLLERVQNDADEIGATVVCEQVNETHVRVLGESRDGSVLVCRLLKDPACGPLATRHYNNFMGELMVGDFVNKLSA